MVLPGSSCTVDWIDFMSGEASFTSAPSSRRIRSGPNSSDSSNPSVETIRTLAFEISGTGTSFGSSQEPARFLLA
jgi:hypothetical protein